MAFEAALGLRSHLLAQLVSPFLGLDDAVSAARADLGGKNPRKNPRRGWARLREGDKLLELVGEGRTGRLRGRTGGSGVSRHTVQG